MAKYRQVNVDGKWVLVPVEELAQREGSMPVIGDIEPFVSPLDGTVVSGRKQYRDHCRKHGVVPAAEFSQEFYERKAAERAKFYDKSKLNRKEVWERKAEINEIINHLTRR